MYSTEKIVEFLNEIPDPEVPAISIVELGVVREVNLIDDGVQIKMTPTYSGCPALKVMEDDIRDKLSSKGITNIEIEMVYSPAWTTDWMSETTREKLRVYGIAPPEKGVSDKSILFSEGKKIMQCPFCGSTETTLTSSFGSTACKSLYFCENCIQPFEHFKCI